MISRSLRAGAHALKTRPGLAILLYLVGAVAGYLIATPIGAAFGQSFTGTGFGPDMAANLDIVLLADFIQENQGVFGAVFGLLLLAVPLFFVWSSITGVGLAYALQNGAGRSFWTGVGRYFWSGLGLTAAFLIPMGIWTGLVGIAAIVAAMTVSGEVGNFWALGVVMPTIWIAGLAAIDLRRDYARIGLVSKDLGVFESMWFGLGFPRRHRASNLIYLIWFVPAAAFGLLPSIVELNLGASFVVFVIQQAALLAAAFVSVGWMGSQVAYYEETRDQELETIA